MRSTVAGSVAVTYTFGTDERTDRATGPLWRSERSIVHGCAEMVGGADTPRPIVHGCVVGGGPGSCRTEPGHEKARDTNRMVPRADLVPQDELHGFVVIVAVALVGGRDVRED